MSFALLLPGTPQALPTLTEEYTGVPLAELAALDNLAELQATFAEMTLQPRYLLGAEHTPAILWLLASQKYPQAKRYLWMAQQGWQELSKLRPLAAQPEQASAVHTRFHADDDPKLIFKAFAQAAWGYINEDNQRQLQELALEAQRRAARNKSLPERVAEAQAGGERAYDLTQELKRRIQQGLSEHDQWIDQVCLGLHDQVKKHLQKELTKILDWRQNRANAGHSVRSTLAAPQMIDGHHPNSLRHLAPAQKWQVLIDETGLHFDSDADTLSSSDKKLGRMVALAIPDTVTLPAKPNFHATDSSPQAVDQMAQQVIEQRLGVFGFTVQDPSLVSVGWIALIEQLMRWVVLQLPIDPSQSVRVEYKIEQRGSYQNSESLQLLAEVLENQCKRLDPERFANLQLSACFINKQHPLVGYVDSVAYTWGSPAAASRDRLKKTAWLGHCLLRTDDRALARLYLAINPQGRLPPSDWYSLCAATLEEPQTGLLNSYLTQLGKRLNEQPERWQQYLEHIRQQLGAKQYRLPELAQALAWLERWQPVGERLPAMWRLLLISSQLSLDNHQGRLNPERVTQCIQLSTQLKEEDAQQACAALLRLAAATTNSFEFELFKPLLQQWLNEPKALVGLLNHGKLHSMLGQLLAFTRHPKAADAHFREALASFARLSDPAQALREQQQTQSYRLFNQFALAPEAQVADVCQHLQTLLHKTDAESISRSLAHDNHARRYEHHLWLRALITYPDQLAAAREAYLEARAQWHSAPGHPWPLIDLYRAWLLKEQPHAAATYLQQAIQNCAQPNHGPILQWMAEVLRCVGLALDLEVERPSAAQREILQQRLPNAPHDALANFAEQRPNSLVECLTSLEHCLPFTLH